MPIGRTIRRQAAFSRVIAIATVLLLPSGAVAQQGTRIAEIQAVRREKAQALEPDGLPKVEEALNFVKEKKLVQRFLSGVGGFRPRLGGAPPEAGIALGLEYRVPHFRPERLLLRSAAQLSFSGFQNYELQFALPQLAAQRLFLDFSATYQNHPRVSYYGPGPDSTKPSRTAFRLENTEFRGTLGARPLRYFTVGTSAGYLLENVGRGTDSRFVSTERIFSDAEAPGIDRQADFVQVSVFAQFDNRDNPGGPHSGGLYAAEYTRFSDQSLGRHDFQRLELHLQQYIPFFQKRRVIALRGKSILTFQDKDQQVPFYLQPSLGGPDDLRGFRSYRFRDDNVLALNLEYRWEVFSGLDAALFADGGKVFPRRSQWNLRNLESSVGFGLRFNVRNSVFLRLDMAFSHEGFHVWFRLNDVFAKSSRDPLESLSQAEKLPTP